MDHHVLQAEAVAFARAREWEQFHDAKNLAMALASEVGELNAIFRWVASSDVDSCLAKEATRHAVDAEIGDVAILLLLLCERTNIDLADAVRNKLAANALKYPVETSRGRSEAP